MARFNGGRAPKAGTLFTPVALSGQISLLWGPTMNRMLFTVADFLSRPPGFYIVLVAMVVCTALVPLGLTDVVTYALSVLAIVITGVVLIQGYRDTAAIHAKLDEIVIALRETRNDVIGLEHADPKEIKEVVETWSGKR